LDIGHPRLKGWGPARSRRFIHEQVTESFSSAIAFLDAPCAPPKHHYQAADAMASFMLELRLKAIALHEASALEQEALPSARSKTPSRI
jgi:hypothetical protein